MKHIFSINLGHRPLRVLIGLVSAWTLVGCAALQPTGREGGLEPGIRTEGAAAPSAPAPAADAGAPGQTADRAGPTLAGHADPKAPAASKSPRIGLDTLNPDQPVDFHTPEARRDLWQRIRDGFAMPELTRPELVRSTEQWYAGRPDYVQRMTTRGSRYLFHIVEEVQRRGLPTELALLPFIESAFNPQALSTAKASGIWQFMPATGRDFDLRQNVFRDDRRNVLASTRAALDYLTRLHAQFGHWHLALAAYNWGEGNLQRAIQRNQRAGLPTDYESLRMPDETRRYVPKLMAVKNIVLQPDQYGLSLPPLENHPYFLTVPIERDIDVSVAARLAGLSVEEFAALNPQHNKPVILAAGTPHILLPYDNAEHFLNAIERHQGHLATWTAWIAPRTLRPAEAAKLTGMNEATLRTVNHIPPGMMIRQGSALLVPRGAQAEDVSSRVADTASINLQREPVARSGKATGRKVQTAKAGGNRSQAAQAQRRGTATASAPQKARAANAAPRTTDARTGSSGGRVASPVASASPRV